MASIFRKDQTAKAPTVYDRIGPEISHLHRGNSTRENGHSNRKAGAWTLSLILLTLIGLFVMDPFLYSMHKSAAFRAYIYLHNYSAPSATTALVASGIFSADDVMEMNERHGSFQDYFSSPQAAEDRAVSVVAFMNGMHNLHEGRYDELDWLGKIRYQLFVRFGLLPPMIWSGINPTLAG